MWKLHIHRESKSIAPKAVNFLLFVRGTPQVIKNGMLLARRPKRGCRLVRGTRAAVGHCGMTLAEAGQLVYRQGCEQGD